MTTLKVSKSLTGELTRQKPLTGKINSRVKLTGSVEKSPLMVPEYEGSYEIRPKVWEQAMLTKGKLMLEDVKIQEIPYQEVTNQTGGKTATIGGY